MRGTDDILGTFRSGRWPAALALIGLAWSGCSQPATEGPSPGEPDGPDEPGVDCSPLTVDPANGAVLPHGLVQLHVRGGSGAWTAALVEAPSGGVVGEHTAAYTAGGVAGVTDVIEVTDAACRASARARVDVLDGLRVLPRRAEVRPGTAVPLRIDGGSGRYACALEVDVSGAAVDTACRYVAGPTRGQDTVRVTDTVTGEVIDAWIAVDPDAALRVAGEGGLFVPLGSRLTVEARHGSGLLALEVLDGDLVVDADAIVGTAAASGHVRVRDRFTGEAVDVPAAVLAPRVTDAPRDGERTGGGVVLALGDKDGDGHPDVALGSAEIAVLAHQGGAVAVYRGSASGPQPTPAQVIAGGTTMETAGEALGIADLTGDGEPDLLVGASRVDQGATNVGALRVYAGIPGALFETAPWRTFYGEEGYDRLGTAVATCDFDGDGQLDLAVGAEDATDRTVGVPAEDQGGVYVYRGLADGFAERPDFVLYGRLPTGSGAFAGVPELHVGASLVAADLDGDGLCDLAAGGPDGGAFGAEGDGVVLVWRGTTDDGLLLEREPARVIAGEAGTGGELGHALAAGDVDGDGAAELAVAQWRADGVATAAGAVLVYRGGALDAGGDLVGPEDADVVVSGSQDDGRLGSALALADLDGDGVLDLVAGAYQEKATRYKQGAVWGWTGLAGAVRHGPSALTEAEATFHAVGAASYDRLGQALDVVGDADGDGDADVVALAGFASTYGVEVGAPTFVSGGTGRLQGLVMPGVAAGHDYGRAVLLQDVDGVAGAELVVGGPGAADPAVGANSGLVETWTSSGTTAARPLGTLDHLGGGDRNGWALASAGDFDGDGLDDVAVVARSDSRPAAFVGDFANPGDCPGLRSSAGAFRVFRGGPGGLQPQPAFVGYGPRSYGYLYELAGGFDHDGDGYGDLVLGSTDWGDGGGVAIVRGREADPSGTTVLCASDVLLGGDDFDRLGDDVAPAGDLDGDGCDELAVGATGEELRGDWSNQGVVRLLWGNGPGCARQAPEVTTVTLEVVGTGLGSALAGGVDVDGDGVPDLVVGGSTYRARFAEVGAAWVVPGAYLLGLPRQALVGGKLPAADATTWSLMLADRGLEDRLGVIGTTAGGGFGEEVAVIDVPGGPLLAVGEPFGGAGGAATGGGVRIFRWTDDGLDEVPWMVVGGEASPGELGAALAVGRFGGRAVLAVGAPRSDRAGLDLGAVYVVPVGP